MFDDSKKKWKVVKTDQAAPSAEEIKAMIQKDVSRLSKMAKATELMGEDALRKGYRISEELRMLGYRMALLKSPSNPSLAEKAALQAAERELPVEAVASQREFESLAKEDRLLLEAFFLMRANWNAAQQASLEFTQKKYKELIAIVKEKKTAFIITSLDETGKPAGAAACAYLPESNSLLIEELAVNEGKKNIGIDSLLVTKAIDVANIKALEEGQAGVEAIVSEAELPAPQASLKENQKRLERMQALINNGVYPVSGFEYSRPEEEQPVEPPPKIPAQKLPQALGGPAPVEYIPEGPVPEARQKEPVAVLLCVRPVNASKEITTRQLKVIVKEVHERHGSKKGLKGLFDQLKGKAVVKIMLVDMKKLLSLGKLLGIALPPPSGEGNEGDEEEKKGKGS